MNDATRHDGQQVGSDRPHLLIHGSEEVGLQHVVASNRAEATAYAEYLANHQNDDSSRIFEMRELDLAFTTYFQVHLVKGQADPLPPNEPHLMMGSGSPQIIPISA